MKEKVKLVYDYIFIHIKDGLWKEGDKIPSEHEFCTLLSVSRTSVRSAIQRYVSYGILESHHGKGTFIRSTDVTLFGDSVIFQNSKTERSEFILITQARSIAEPEVLAYAAEHATPELIEKLETANRKMQNSLGNQREFIESDMEFHRITVDFMENKIISAYFDKLLTYNRANISCNEVFGYFDGIRIHNAFLDAIKERNPQKARRLSIDHFANQLTIAKELEQLSAAQSQSVPDVSLTTADVQN